MQTYRSMKDSGVAWLGDIPSGWELKKSKYIFRKVQEKPFKDDDVVTAFRDGEVVLRKLRREDGFTFADKEIGYQHVKRGDLVVHAMDAFAGAIGVSKSDGKMSPVCSICRPVNDDVDTRYYAYLLRSMSKTNYLVAIAKGIRERSTDFRYSDLGNMHLPLPTLPEQQKVVSFLDIETAKIDTLIAKQECLLGLLEEKRRATITLKTALSTARKGPLKRFLKWIGRGASPTYAENGSVRFINQACIYWDGLKLGGIKYADERSHRPGERGSLVYGDVLLNSTGTGTLGRAAIFHETEHGYFADSHITIVRPLVAKLDSIYLKFLIESDAFQDQIYKLCVSGSTNQIELSKERLSNLPVSIPSIEEQKKVVEEIENVNFKIFDTKSMIVNEIKLLKERRTSLISNVVTGKIKV